MGAVNIHLTREKVISTDAYKRLNKIMQKITSKRNNVLVIQHGVNVAKNIGYDKWLSQSNFSWANREIVEELVNE